MATDQIQFRGNSPDDPKLFDRFQAVLKTYGGDRASILRALTAAYCDCVDREGALPRLPLHVETKKVGK